LTKNEIIKLYGIKKDKVILIDRYLKHLKKNNTQINLVGRSTLFNAWDRHVSDSLQLTQFIKNKKSKIIDLGTGAGIPGIIISIMGYNNIVMVDSKKKKIEFVKSCLSLLPIKPTLINSRIEDMKKITADFIVARALSPLFKLINYSLFFANNNTTMVFLKGRSVNIEINEAKKKFFFNYNLYKTKTSGDGFVVKIKNIKRK